MDLILQAAIPLSCMSWRLHVIPILLALLCNAPNAAHAFQVPVMFGLGDSITAGALADTSTQSDWPFPDGDPIPSLDNPLDGIGFNSDYENKRTYSWVTGQKVQSHYMRLRDWMQKTQGKNLWALNFAVSGSLASDVIKQMDEVRTALKTGLVESIPYVTLMVGANDLCGATPMETYRKNIREILSELSEIQTQQKQPLHVLLSSIPHIPILGEPSFTYFHTSAGPTCDQIRSLHIEHCDRMLKWHGLDEKQRLMNEVDQVNQILKEEAAAATSHNPGLLTHYSSKVVDADFDVTRMAIDCFHPNAVGQAELAQKLWDDLPWFH